MLTTLSHCIVY